MGMYHGPAAFSCLLLLLLLLLLLSVSHHGLALADATWLYPPADGLRFYYKDTINIAYENDVAWTYLGTYCVYGVGQLTQEDTVPGFNGTTPIVLELLNGTSLIADDQEDCWFALREDYQGDGKNSPSFQYIHTPRGDGPSTLGLTATISSSSAFSAPTTASGGSSTSLSTSTGAGASATSPAQVPNTSSSQDLSAGALVGIGVAAGVLGILLLVAGVVFIRRYRKRHQRSPVEPSYSTMPVVTTTKQWDSYEGGGGGGRGGAGELAAHVPPGAGRRPPAELSTGHVAELQG